MMTVFYWVNGILFIRELKLRQKETLKPVSALSPFILQSEALIGRKEKGQRVFQDIY